jgi:hypothetical protein
VTGAWVGLAALSLPCAARAQTAPEPSAQAADDATGQARALFDEASSMARHGDWSQALLAFERSAALRPHSVTTYDIGFCERALGRTTRARKMLGKALAENAARGGAELPERLATAARTYLAELQGRVAHALVTVAPEGASIRVDGRPLEPGPATGTRPVFWAGTRDIGPGEPVGAATFELEIDAGAHVIVLSKEGFPDQVTTRDFEAGSQVDLRLELPPLPARRPGPQPAPPHQQGAQAPGPGRVPLHIALGVGGAGLMIGAIAGGIALAQRENVVRNCAANFACTGAGATYLARMDTAADVSTAGFIVGGVGALTAAVIWSFSLASPGSTGKASAGRFAPWVSPRGGGVTGTF